MKRVVIVGHGSIHRAAVIAALVEVCKDVTLCDSGKNGAVDHVMLPNIPEPMPQNFLHKKSKGDKHRDRSERKRKWGI
jgi:hypothetical protein